MKPKSRTDLLTYTQRLREYVQGDAPGVIVVNQLALVHRVVVNLCADDAAHEFGRAEVDHVRAYLRVCRQCGEQGIDGAEPWCTKCASKMDRWVKEVLSEGPKTDPGLDPGAAG